MQLSDREIQNTLDFLKKKKGLEGDFKDSSLSGEREPGEFEEVVRKIGNVPEVRHEKVAKVKKALESSTYNVTSDDVAKKLIGRIFSDKLR
jgi:anti-sigma28 factor (negative regulator of flagellin synthesis)